MGPESLGSKATKDLREEDIREICRCLLHESAKLPNWRGLARGVRRLRAWNGCDLQLVCSMVGAAGFEPATAGLEIRCSIRLSYAPGLLQP